MKTKPRFFLSLGLLVVLLASCVPVAATEAPVQPVAIVPSATFPPPAPTLDQGVLPTQVIEAPTEAIAPTPFPVATSRGPNLEATDPMTVSMASGGLQFVEFFEFW